MKNLLEIRNKLKEKTPDFLKQDAHKKDKLKNNWRKPRGRDSKMRLKYRGYRKSPSVGYSSPRKVKGLNKEGFGEIFVNNVTDLDKVKDEVIIISSSVGMNKKLKILEMIKNKGLKVSNIKNIDEYVKKVEEIRREKIEKKKMKKGKKKEEKPKKEKEEKPKKDMEEKKKEEERIKRKVLESRTTK